MTNERLIENLEKAAQCGELLVSDVREAYSAAKDTFAELVLLDLVVQAAELRRKLDGVLKSATL